MNSLMIGRVSASFQIVSPRLDELVETFYRRLFEEYPGVRAMFPAEMSRQRAHLAASLALVAKNIARLDMLDEPLMGLGAAHVKYGARPEHYPIVRDVMLDALGEVAGEAFTAEARAAWHEALSAVAAAMLRGAAREASRTAEEVGMVAAR